jgi:hypothetical protein
MNAARVVFAAAALLAGCSTAQTVVLAEPVIAGKAYGKRPVALGAVKMTLDLQPQAAEPADAAAGEQLELTLGFLATGGETTSVVAQPGTLRSLKDGAAGELTARLAARGSPIECVAEPGLELGNDYWFNGTVGPREFKCVVLRFRVPGHRPGDPLELSFEPVNVGGRPVRVLPVTFAYRTQELEVD